MLKKSAGLIHLIGDKAQLVAGDSNEVDVHEFDVVILKPETVGSFGV